MIKESLSFIAYSPFVGYLNLKYILYYEMLLTYPLYVQTRLDLA